MASIDNVKILLSAVTTGTSDSFDVGSCLQVAFETEWSAGTSAGVVVIEHSFVTDYAGTWANLDTQTQSASTLAFGTMPAPLGFLRARVTTTVVDGTVTVRARRLYADLG